MKTMLAVKGVREGVEVRTGVWRDSDSVTAVDEEDAAGLLGMVILGLGFSIFVDILVEGPGLECSGSILMPPKDEIDECGSESESESSILQMGR